MTDKRNILFIFPDQLSARWLEDDRVATPNLDAFAKQSVRFSEAYTNCPLCTPYRACLFTGQYPTQTGVMKNGMSLPPNTTTIADLLNGAGYATHYIGKWHLSGDPQCNRWVPPEQRGGFRNFVGWESHHVDHFAGKIWRNDPDAVIEMRGHETDGLTDIVCDEIKQLGRDPFFLVVSYQAPHPPCTPPPEYTELYHGTDLCGDPTADRDAWYDKPGWNADYSIQEFRERHFAEITHLDAAFGRVLDALSETGLDDNTIVVFTSDHGEMAGAHGVFGKGVMYDEAVRVPLLIRLPEPDGRVVSAAVSTVDLHATCLDLCGCHNASEGNSFAGALRSGKDLLPAPVFIDYRERCVIDGPWKLAVDRETNKPTMLFDRGNDPHEQTNLIDDDRCCETKEVLAARLQEFAVGLQTESNVGQD